MIHCNIGSLFQELEQYSAATEHYERALQIDPQLAAAHHGRGWILHDQGDLKAALAHYLEALRLRPDFALTHCSIGTVLQELGDLNEAERSFREAIRCDHDHSAAHAQLATLLRGKLPADDLTVLRKLVANPNLTDGKRSALHFGLAHVDDARNDYAAASGVNSDGPIHLNLLERKQPGPGLRPRATRSLDRRDDRDFHIPLL